MASCLYSSGGFTDVCSASRRLSCGLEDARGVSKVQVHRSLVDQTHVLSTQARLKRNAVASFLWISRDMRGFEMPLSAMNPGCVGDCRKGEQRLAFTCEAFTSSLATAILEARESLEDSDSSVVDEVRVDDQHAYPLIKTYSSQLRLLVSRLSIISPGGRPCDRAQPVEGESMHRTVKGEGVDTTRDEMIDWKSMPVNLIVSQVPNQSAWSIASVVKGTFPKAPFKLASVNLTVPTFP